MVLLLYIVYVIVDNLFPPTLVLKLFTKLLSKHTRKITRISEKEPKILMKTKSLFLIHHRERLNQLHC